MEKHTVIGFCFHQFDKIIAVQRCFVVQFQRNITLGGLDKDFLFFVFGLKNLTVKYARLWLKHLNSIYINIAIPISII